MPDMNALILHLWQTPLLKIQLHILYWQILFESPFVILQKSYLYLVFQHEYSYPSLPPATGTMYEIASMSIIISLLNLSMKTKESPTISLIQPEKNLLSLRFS